MPASIKQLAARRRMQRIPRAELHRRLDCSDNWLRWLENGLYTGPCVATWRDRYEEALNKAIEDREAKAKV